MRTVDSTIKHRLEKLLETGRFGRKSVEQHLNELLEISRGILGDREAENAAKVFAALSDPTRIKILKLLEKRMMCVCELMIALDLSQPATSYHLKLLQNCGLIKSAKEGRWVFYGLSDRKLVRLIFRIIEHLGSEHHSGELEV